MADEHLVTVIIPVFNRRNLLRHAIESVRAQTYPYWELIVVDDGSSERIADLIEAFDDPRIACLRQMNQGVSTARNLGIQHARGEFVTFLDSDDLYDRHCLQLKVEYALKHPEVGVVGGGCQYFSENGAQPINPTHARISTTYEDLAVFTAFPGATGNIFVRRSVLLAAGGFRTNLVESEDRELLQRLAQLAPVGSVPDLTLIQRVHGEIRAERDITSVIYSRQWIRSKIKDAGLRRKAKAWDEFTLGVKYWYQHRGMVAFVYWCRSFLGHRRRIHPELKRISSLLEHVLPRRMSQALDSLHNTLKQGRVKRL
ncbi:MAG TPA: glycosyltransferase [Steroidobacteraceae bacterium]|nr:glycosyltransferase [Steroidobacteraceae bacterium]